MSIEIKSYGDLSVDEFHDLIALRIAVFVVEQNCPYPELDGKDKVAFHLIVRDDATQIVGTARILPAGVSYENVSIGRVVVNSENRAIGLGHTIMKECCNFITQMWGEKVPITISAQSHLTTFYNQHGFETSGSEYLEDGIPHKKMIRIN